MPEVPQKKKIMLCTPMYGGLCYGTFVESCLQTFSLAAERGIEFQYGFIYNESLVQRARNVLANIFMRSNCTHLLFIDGDINFQPHDVLTLIDANEPIIGGSYPKKCINWNRVAAACKAGIAPQHLEHCSGDHVVHLPKGVHEIQVMQGYETPYLGTGFMLIARECFEAFQRKFPNHWCVTHDVNIPTPFWIYFDCAIERNEEGKPVYLSEDYWFCYRMKDCGYKPKFIPALLLGHTGTYTFRGCKLCSEGAIIHNIKESTNDSRTANKPIQGCGDKLHDAVSADPAGCCNNGTANGTPNEGGT